MDDQQQFELIVSPDAHANDAKDPAFFKPDVALIILTWVAFIILLIVLRKYAWNPILEGLDKRERDIRKAVEEADDVRLKLQKIEQTRENILIAARSDAQSMIEEARQAAREAGKGIEKQAKDQAQIIAENAERDAKDATNKAYAQLKQQSADMIVTLASKLVRENMNDEKNKKLVNELVKDI